MYWPPRFCRKGEKNCVGPYMKRFKWKYNTNYTNLKKAVGDNQRYFREEMDYEIGYDWTKSSKFEKMGLQYGTNGYIEEYWDGLHCVR